MVCLLLIKSLLYISQWNFVVFFTQILHIYDWGYLWVYYGIFTFLFLFVTWMPLKIYNFFFSESVSYKNLTLQMLLKKKKTKGFYSQISLEKAYDLHLETLMKAGEILL